MEASILDSFQNALKACDTVKTVCETPVARHVSFETSPVQNLPALRVESKIQTPPPEAPCATFPLWKNLPQILAVCLVGLVAGIAYFFKNRLILPAEVVKPPEEPRRVRIPALKRKMKDAPRVARPEGKRVSISESEKPDASFFEEQDPNFLKL